MYNYNHKQTGGLSESNSAESNSAESNSESKKYFTGLFFKMFAFLEVSLIALALIGIYKFSLVYYENHQQQVANEIRGFLL